MLGNNFLILGNDKKMHSCLNRLNESGLKAYIYSKDNSDMLSFPQNIILPLPSLSNGNIAGTQLSISEFESFIHKDSIVFYGNIPVNPFMHESYSYYYDESFLVKNSRLTAQAVLKIILENTESDISDMNAAVIGYGRCGKAICRILKGAFVNVTSFSRSVYTKTLAQNEKLNTEDCKNIENELYKYDVIVNTVPVNIIGEKALEKLNSRNLYVETASRPYGFNIADVDKFNFRYVLAESLPGKHTPQSAGEIIADTVLGIVKEGKNE